MSKDNLVSKTKQLLEEQIKPTWHVEEFEECEKIIYDFPEVFKTIITTIDELNNSFVQLITTEVMGLQSCRRLVPVMIVRSLIDCAFILKGYLLYKNKPIFVKYYKDGTALNKLCFKVNGEKQYFTTNYLKSELEKDFEGISSLYDDCCKWVHPNYIDSKFSLTGLFGGGRIGFRGKTYEQSLLNYSLEEIMSELLDNYDYEEECDITDYAIFANKIISELFKEIEKVYVPTDEDKRRAAWVGPKK